jgi:eukaryotic-like serine/threonine-protein kinase
VPPKYEIFGKYILLDKVAMGGMAEVYRAKAPGAQGIGKILAIKRILPQFSNNSEFIEMFKTEAQIAINLTQANIAQIYEFGQEKEQFFLLMEYIDGRNLRQILSRCTKLQKALTIEQCVFVINQVAAGLDYAHRCLDKNSGSVLNIIHRDMSPQNIMVSFEGEVKIVDFGIAKAESKIEVTRAGTLKGKFGYMSPEQAEGADLDARTDIFSTGIVLWELLTGERLFVANNEVNTIRKIKECQIPAIRKINPNIHEELERITMKALAKDRNLRYQTSGELHRDLSHFLYRVNPEFTAHDLAVSLKTFFKEDILEDRKKLIEFSKVNPSKFQPAADHTGSSIQTMTEPNTTGKNTKTEKSRSSGFPTKINEIKLEKNTKALEIQAPNQHRQTAVTFHGTQSHQQFNNPYASSRNSGTLIGQRPVAAKNRKWITPVLLMVMLVTAGFLLFHNANRIVSFTSHFIKQVSEKGSALLSSTASQSQNTGVDIPPTPIKAHVMVHSIPAGATINVDGQDFGTTPAEILVDMNKKVSLSLRRDGYIPYSKQLVATISPEDFTATLQKAIVGYLNIDVRPTTATIFINGEKLGERTPISRYPVPAGKSLVIKAVNPYLNTHDEQNVNVKQDTVKDVTLFLHK